MAIRFFCVDGERYVSFPEFPLEGPCYFRGKGSPHLEQCGWYLPAPVEQKGESDGYSHLLDPV